jgi:hypothetical protein
VKLGNVLNRNIFDPQPRVRRSRSSIMERMRALLVVMSGTKKFGKPKWDR